MLSTVPITLYSLIPQEVQYLFGEYLNGKKRYEEAGIMYSLAHQYE